MFRKYIDPGACPISAVTTSRGVDEHAPVIQLWLCPMPSGDYRWAWDQAYRSTERVNGTLSGATAPPEMMKLMAWSTVQSVGVSISTGTISR